MQLELKLDNRQIAEHFGDLPPQIATVKQADDVTERPPPITLLRLTMFAMPGVKFLIQRSSSRKIVSIWVLSSRSCRSLFTLDNSSFLAIFWAFTVVDRQRGR